MLAYRVVPILKGAQEGEKGHPEYIHRPQMKGRLDNPNCYDLYYLSATEGGAVGETLARHPQWTKAILDFKALPGSVLSLCTFVIDDDVRLLDMDDAQTLQDLGLRPTQVVTRNRAVTQRWARKIWEEHDFQGRTWDGIRWWSRHHAEWPVFAVWNTGLCKVDDIVPLKMKHRAVRDAAKVLNK